jgi:hypothetical protein
MENRDCFFANAGLTGNSKYFILEFSIAYLAANNWYGRRRGNFFGNVLNPGNTSQLFWQ